MQTISSMRRNSTYQALLIDSFAFLLFCLYSFLGDFFVWLPPLVGVLFVLFCARIQTYCPQDVLFVVCCLLFWEMDKGVAFGLIFSLFCVFYLFLFKWCVFFIQKGFKLRIFLVSGFYLLFFNILFALGFFESLYSMLALLSISIFLESIWMFFYAIEI